MEERLEKISCLGNQENILGQVRMILVAIEGCEAHWDRYQAQRKTWAIESWVSSPTDFSGDAMCFTGKMLGVPDDYVNLPAKTKAICQFALKHGYDYLFKCDTDTYVHLPRLLAADFAEHDYSGFVLNTFEIPYCSGPHYWLSRKAFEILAKADWDAYHLTEHSTCEDVMVGCVLHAAGIFPHHDHRYSPFIPVLPSNDVISHHLTTNHSYQLSLMHEAHEAAHDH